MIEASGKGHTSALRGWRWLGRIRRLPYPQKNINRQKEQTDESKKGRKEVAECRLTDLALKRSARASHGSVTRVPADHGPSVKQGGKKTTGTRGARRGNWRGFCEPCFLRGGTKVTKKKEGKRRQPNEVVQWITAGVVEKTEETKKKPDQSQGRGSHPLVDETV